MNSCRSCRPLCMLFFLCALLNKSATQTSTQMGGPGPTTPFPYDPRAEDPTEVSEAPTVPTEDPTVGPTTPFPYDPRAEDPTEVSEAPTVPTEDPTVSTGAPSVFTEAPTVSTVQPVLSPQVCVCDLSPGFCDIGCCCDTVDCGVANLSTVFTGCPNKAVSGVCIEKWMMFRANVDSSLVTETDSLFCIRSEDKAPKSPPRLPDSPALGDSYHFSPPAPAGGSHSRDFYRVDDIIQTFFSDSSVRGLLRQPSPGPAAESCINRNPAKFLRSVAVSCTKTLSYQTCTTDPSLNARSYFSDLSLIKIPLGESIPVFDFLIPVKPLSEWPAPELQKNLCVNVVKNVEFVIGYTGRGEIINATVNIVLADVDPKELLSQTHSVQFQLATDKPTPEGHTSPVGLAVGSPLIGRADGNAATVTTLGVSQSGECSPDPGRRSPVLFTHNTITGCTLSSPSRNCSELRAQIYGILIGLASPDEIAMNSGSQLSWTRVVTQECPVMREETCESGCLLPDSLSIRVLWARQGLLDHPQSYILGAKYLFECQNVKCPLSSRLALTTEVTFADTTVHPDPARGSPQPDWKFPFGFFTRGSDELDGHIVINSGASARVTWTLILFTVLLLTGLELFR